MTEYDVLNLPDEGWIVISRKPSFGIERPWWRKYAVVRDEADAWAIVDGLTKMGEK